MLPTAIGYENIGFRDAGTWYFIQMKYNAHSLQMFAVARRRQFKCQFSPRYADFLKRT
jgi:hypothetical protein